MRRAIALAASVLVLTVAACSHSKKAAGPARTTTSSSSTTTTVAMPTVKVEKLTGGTTSPYVYDYAVEYPQLEGLPDQAMQRAINADLSKAASDLVGDFVVLATKDEPTTTTTVAAPASTSTSGGPGTSTRLDGKSETTLLDQRVASFRLTAFNYILPAAHGFTKIRTFSYDLTTGRRLMLTDLFKPGIDYLGWLSRESDAQLKARPDVYQPSTPDGLTPTEDHFAHFVLTPAGVDIEFDEYQVGPYAIGTPHVSFPYAQLRPLLASPGPLDGR